MASARSASTRSWTTSGSARRPSTSTSGARTRSCSRSWSTRTAGCAPHFRAVIDERGGDDPRARLLALFDVVDGVVHLEEFRGCFFVNVAMEFPLAHMPAHVAAASSKLAIQGIIAELAREARAREPETLARELMLLMEGAYVTSHVTGDKDAAETARRAAEVLIDRSLVSEGDNSGGPNRKDQNSRPM